MTLITIMISSNSSPNIDFKNLYGDWTGNYLGIDIFFKVTNDRGCKIELINKSENTKEVFNGNCFIDLNKYPYSLTMKNIQNKDYSLYTVIKSFDGGVLEITQFSTKWRLREINLSKKNIITLNKI